MNSDTIKYFRENPGRLVSALGSKGYLNWMPDKLYLQIVGSASLGYKLNLDNPRTFNEKLNWLKLHDRKPEYTRMVDKYAVREYIAEKIGEQYLIPLVGGPWDSFEEIDFSSLPEQFVLKTTHDSGGVVICRNKANFDMEAARQKLTWHLKREYFWGKREWPYKNVKPRIIEEAYLEDKETQELRDYKFFCFGGKVKALFIAEDRQGDEETKFDFFDADFHHLDIRNGHPNASVPPEKPLSFEKMKEMAERLSQGIPHLRVDFYEANGKIYFGELTFSHWSGFTPFEPEEWDLKFGEWLKLPLKKLP